MSNVNCVNSKIIKSASKQTINTISLSDDSKTFVIGQDYGENNDPTLSLFDIETGKCFEVIERSENNTNSVYNVCLSSDGKKLISAGEGGKVVVRDIEISI